MTNQIPHYLRRYRLAAALTQKEMAHLLGCQSPATVCQYEARSREPDLRTALAYQVAFSVPIEELFPGIFGQVEEDVIRRADHLAKQLTGANGNPALAHKRRAVGSIIAADSVRATDGEPQPNV
jgi:transcriptional regulator with XRE-family HTH domain